MPRPERNTASAGVPGACGDAAAATLEHCYEQGLALIGRGAYFEAHEQLELAWRAAEPPERDFFQGLVHVAVAWHQAGRGRRIGCERQLEKALRRLTPYLPRRRGLELAPLLKSLERALARVRGGSLALDPPVLSPHRSGPPD